MTMHLFSTQSYTSVDFWNLGSLDFLIFSGGLGARSFPQLGQRALRRGEQCYLPEKGDAAPLSWAQPIQILPPNVLEVRAVPPALPRPSACLLSCLETLVLALRSTARGPCTSERTPWRPFLVRGGLRSFLLTLCARVCAGFYVESSNRIECCG